MKPVALAVLAVSAVAAVVASSCSVTSVLNVASGGRTAQRDVPYGSGPRQVYDLYPAKEDGPVLVFVHGGSWDTGSKELYPFVGNYLAGHGITTAIINYRLGPVPPFPAFVEDAARAVSVIRRDVAGGKKVVLMGHSAGAQIAALVAYDPRYLSAFGTSPCEAVAGFVGLAGPYDFLPLVEERYKRIFPAATRAQSQPLNFARGRHPPSLLLHGTDDRVVEAKDTTVMAAALRAAGNRVEARLLPGVSHTDIVGAFGPVLSFLAPVREPVLRFAKAAQGCS